MKILLHWLEELLQTPLEAEKTAHILTSVGLEVEAVTKIASVNGGLEGLVCGKVLECQPHPNADRLKLTRVMVQNGEILDIVCGASNVHVGQHVVVALPGSILYPKSGEPLKIKKSKIRGVESNGMLCAEDEIGLGTSHEGIMELSTDITPGTPLKNIYPVFEDILLEIGLTPNRGDAASHLGVARDLKAWLNVHEGKKLELHFSYPAELPESSGIQGIKVELLSPELCPRYSGAVISGLNNGKIPPEMKFRLEACGMRTVHPVVDITNYVLLECGQPLHAFDYDSIKGKKIIVGQPHGRLPFVLLDGTIVELNETDLVIGNKEEPMCLAGIYGGKNSGVNNDTRTIFLESAYFTPSGIRKSSNRLKLKTDASFRFERGTHPGLVIPALHRAVSLIMSHCGGTLSYGPVDVYPKKIEPRKVAFSFSLCNDLLGHEIPHDTVHSILEQLEIRIEAESKDGALCIVPAYKHDVLRQADLTEEVARIYGFNHIPPSEHFLVPGTIQLPSGKERIKTLLLDFFTHKGWHEVQGLSLEKSEWHFATSSGAVSVLNPVSAESAFLRKHLFYSGMQILTYNIHRQQKDLRLFELGKIYSAAGKGFEERDVLGLYSSGKIFGLNHYKLDYPTGLSDHLGMIYELTDMLGMDLEVQEYSDENLHGISIWHEKHCVGHSGYPTSTLRKKFDADEKIPLCLTQLFLDALYEIPVVKTQFKALPQFPSVRRDLAVIVDKNIPYGHLLKHLREKLKINFLKDIRLFDVYEGKNIPKGKKSLAFSFHFQSDQHTLKEIELQQAMDQITGLLCSEWNAEIRE